MSSACKKEGLEEGDFRQIHSSEEDSNRCVYLEQLLVNGKYTHLNVQP